MLVSKLLEGVVVVERGSSRRAFRPKFVHRLLLAWLFRHFASLPMSVLTASQKALVANIIANGRTTPVPDGDFGTIIGTVESVIPQADHRKPVASSTGWEFARRGATGDRISA
ncbi:MAG: hypothetical protein LAN70_05300 [Acidobacteriia bacterium]|nr:hypothetical protein [Terriglobia bacterium]